jgi:hypothetical protein
MYQLREYTVLMIRPRNVRPYRLQSIDQLQKKIWQELVVGRRELKNGLLNLVFKSILHLRNNRLNSQNMTTRMAMETMMTSCLQLMTSIKLCSVRPQIEKCRRWQNRLAVDSIVTARCCFSYLSISWLLTLLVICRVQIQIIKTNH